MEKTAYGKCSIKSALYLLLTNKKKKRPKVRSEAANDPSLGAQHGSPPPPARTQDGGLASSPRSQDGRRLTTSPRGERAVGRGLAAACRAG